MNTRFLALSFVILAGCGSSESYVVDRAIVPGGTYVTVQGLTASSVDKIVVSALSSTTSVTTTQALSFDRTSGAFAGYLVLAPDSYTVTAVAYAPGADAGLYGYDAGAPAVLGRGSASLVVQAGATASLALDIRDASRGGSQSAIPVVITQFLVAKARLSPNEPVQLSATAVDLNSFSGPAPVLSYSWSDDCGGTFKTPNAASTIWFRGTAGGCNLKVTARSSSYAPQASKTASVAVVANADGTIGIGGQFVARPELSYVTAWASFGDGGTSTLYVYRYGAQTIFSVPAASTIWLNPTWQTDATDAGQTLGKLTSTCAAPFSPSTIQANQTSTWLPGYGYSTDGGSMACRVDLTVSNVHYPELNDSLSFGVELY